MPQLLNHQGRVAVDGVNFDGIGQFKFALVDGGVNISRQATATLTLKSGSVTAVTVTDGGAGYTSVPSAIVQDGFGGNGSGAVLQAVVAGGAVTAINVVKSGSNYSLIARVVIDAPPANMIYQSWWVNAQDILPADGEPDDAVLLPVVKGLYSVLLGDITRANMAALESTVFTNSDVRLRVWFNDGTHGFQQLAPDSRVAAAGYALIAGDVPDGIITSEKIANGAVGSEQISDGGVTSEKIEIGAIGSTQLAVNAVQSANIAPGVITDTQLAKPPRSGVVSSSTLNVQFHEAEFTVPFSPPFSSTPVVTMAVLGEFESVAPALSLTSATTTNFTARLNMPVHPQTSIIDSVNEVGLELSMTVLADGRPAIAYLDETDDDLMFVRALSDDCTEWSYPITLDSTGLVGWSLSLALVNGNPAVAYYDKTNGDLKYIRAYSSNGSTWASPITVDSAGDVGYGACLTVVNGSPAIAYRDTSNGYLKYIRAADANGNTWDTPRVIDTDGGSQPSLVVVNGNPAVAYFDADNYNLKYIRSSDAFGISWGASAILDSSGYTGVYPSLAVVDGRPAVAYLDFSNYELRYISASNANGSSWNSPMTLDSDGTTGFQPSLAVVDGKPAIAYFENYYADLRYVRAIDAAGSIWSTPVMIDGEKYVGSNPSLVLVSGHPAVAYYDITNANLRFIRSALPSSFSVQWIALEP